MRSVGWLIFGAALCAAQGCGGMGVDPVDGAGPMGGGPAGETGGGAGSGGAATGDGGPGVEEGGGGASSTSPDAAVVDAGPPPMGLHVVTTPTPHIEDANGKTIVLHGVNRSGTEYRCVQNGTDIFDGPSDDASVQAIASWKVNAVRVPLNEACWLGLAQNGAMPGKLGDAYKTAIRDFVSLLQKYGLVPILDLHWVGPGTSRADRLQPLPDADHAPAFWSDVANTFKDNGGVVFEPFNEPFPDGNRDTQTAWQCWRDGCVATQAVAADAGPTTYQATGMQALVTAIRSAGASNLVLLGGVQYSNGLSQWLTYKPVDPMNNLAAAWHVYSNNPCAGATCWSGVPSSVAAQVPIVATEIGESDCRGTFIAPLMQFLDQHGLGYLAWSWNAFGVCRPAMGATRGQPWSLVMDYATGTPNPAQADAGVGSSYAQTFHDHVMSLGATP